MPLKTDDHHFILEKLSLLPTIECKIDVIDVVSGVGTRVNQNFKKLSDHFGHLVYFVSISTYEHQKCNNKCIFQAFSDLSSIL